ncbi:MAG TPA: hypothetical protein VFX18_01180 [Candidatus Nitrosocosmicus sp.]|nr:hypothetical protein [Candidatus Nitrosocosmicus sp.]
MDETYYESYSDSKERENQIKRLAYSLHLYFPFTRFFNFILENQELKRL